MASDACATRASHAAATRRRVSSSRANSATTDCNNNIIRLRYGYRLSRRSVGLDERDEQQNAEGKGYQELEQLFTTRGESALKTPEECSAGLGADDSRRTFRLLLMACALPPAGGLLVLVLVRAAPLALPGRRRVPEGARAASVRLLVSVRFGVVGARGGDAAA